jgi:hypothetical protein
MRDVRGAARAWGVGVAAIAALTFLATFLALRGIESSPDAASAARLGTTQVDAAAATDHGGPPRRAHAAADAATAADDPVPDGVWRGLVVTGDNAEPVAGADVELVTVDPSARVVRWVWLEGEAAPVARATTDADGRFEFAAREGGPWYVRVARPGFATATRHAPPSDPVVLAPSVRRTIEVVDTSGAPVAGAAVAAGVDFPGEAIDATALPAFRAVTDDHGRAPIDVADGSNVFVLARGFELRAMQVERRAERVRLVLGRGAEIGGVVVDTTGAPLAGVRVFADRDESWDHQSDCTGEDGTFRFGSLDADDTSDCGLVVDVPGRVRTQANVSPGDTDVRIVVPRAGSVSGVVVGEDGAGVGGAWVTAGPAGLHTENDGVFRFESLPPGRFVLAARMAADGGTREASRLLDLAEGQVVSGVRLVLEPDPEFSYVSLRAVHSDGTPAAGMAVTVRDGDRECGSGLSGVAGEVVVRVLRPSGTVVDASATWVERQIVSSAGIARGCVTAATPTAAPVTLQVGPPPVVVPTFSDEQGRAIPAEDVRATASVGTIGAVSADVRAIAVDPGTFAVVRFAAAGRAEVDVRLDPPHPPQRDLAVVLPRECVVTGRVVQADGSPPGTKCTVQVATWAGDRWAGNEFENTAADGRFEIRGLAAGRMYAWISFDDRFRLRPIGAEIAVGAHVDLGDLVVAPLHRLDGVVAALDGTPLGGAIVEFVRDDGIEIAGDVATDAAGRFGQDVPSDLPLTLRVRRRGRATTFVGVDAGARGVHVAMPPECVVRVRSPVSWRYASFHATQSETSWEPDADEPVFVDERTIERTLRGLPAGTLVLRTDERRGAAERTVVTSPGASPVVVFGDP